jgi:AcrR family transcriptional regulator
MDPVRLHDPPDEAGMRQVAMPRTGKAAVRVQAAHARPHTGRRRNEAVRRAILGAALAILREGNMRDLTIGGIAERAGVGRQTIYRWWPSKDAVVAEAMTYQAREIVPVPDTGMLRSDLTAFLEDSFKGTQDPGTQRMLRQVMSAAQHDAHVAGVLADFTSQRRAELRGLLARGRDRGELPADANLDMLADLAYGFLWYRLLVGHAPLDARAAEDLAAHLIAAGAA